MEELKKDSWVTLPNMLTFIRILLIPVFGLMMIERKACEALVIFSLAGLTDVLDGFAARLWHQKSKIGTLLDPAADKFLMTMSFIFCTIRGLSFPYSVPIWLTVVVISRDFVLASGAFLVYLTRGRKIFLPTVLGKASTVCQVGTIFLVLFSNYVQRSSLAGIRFLSILTSASTLSWIYPLTLAVTLFSGIHYGIIGFRMIFSRRKAKLT